jgi:hypothetical protein
MPVKDRKTTHAWVGKIQHQPIVEMTTVVNEGPEEPYCWKCGADGANFQDGGQDDNGHPITVCPACGERQEEE